MRFLQRENPGRPIPRPRSTVRNALPRRTTYCKPHDDTSRREARLLRRDVPAVSAEDRRCPHTRKAESGAANALLRIMNTTLPWKTGNSNFSISLWSLALLAGAFVLQGCSSREQNEDVAKGAAAGAVIGGVIGHQSEEEAEGAAIGAAAGAAIGGALSDDEDEEAVGAADADADVDDADVDYGELMTEAEKEKVLDRADREVIYDWGDYLTEDEKLRLLRRAERQS